MISTSIFTNGGTVPTNSIYLCRKVDSELLSLCRRGEYTYVLTTRQVGKSSLMVRIHKSLKKEGIRSIIVDLQATDNNSEPDEWFFGLLILIKDQLNLQTDPIDWWNNHKDLGIKLRFISFFETVVLEETNDRIVIFIDEIDRTLGLKFSDTFFTAIRYLFNSRSLNSELRRLSFVLVGVATPSDLVDDPIGNPFNIGHRVELTDFAFNEVLPLVEGMMEILSLSKEQAESLMKWVLDWTGGHPYLTQHFCIEIVESNSISPDTLSKEAIDKIALSTFLGERSQTNNNLQFVREMLIKRSPNSEKTLNTYRRILKGDSVSDEEHSPIKNHLKLSGIVKRDGNTLRVRNKIYRQTFNQKWIQEHLDESWKAREKILLGLLFLIGFPAIVACFAWYVNKSVNESIAKELKDFTGRLNVATPLLPKKAPAAESNSNKEKGYDPQGALAIVPQVVQGLDDINSNLKNPLLSRFIPPDQFRSGLNENIMRLKEILKQAREIDVSDRFGDPTKLKRFDEAKIPYSDEAEVPYIESIALNSNGTKLLIGGGQASNCLLRLMSVNNGKLTKAETGYWDLCKPNLIDKRSTIGHIYSVAFSPNGELIAAASSDRNVYLWKLKNDNQPEFIKPFVGHTDVVYSVAFSPDGETIVSAGRSSEIEGHKGEMFRWNLQGSILKPFPTQGSNTTIRAVTFSPDNKKIFSAGDENVIREWALNSNNEPSAFPKLHDQPIRAIAINPSNNKIASASEDKTVRLWNKTVRLWNIGKNSKSEINLQDELLVGLQWGKCSVQSLAFSPDGKYIATGSEDGIVRVWDSELSQVMWQSSYQKDASPVCDRKMWAVAFSYIKDNNVKGSKSLILASGGQHKDDPGKIYRVRLWDLKTLEGESTKVQDSDEFKQNSSEFKQNSSELKQIRKDACNRLVSHPILDKPQGDRIIKEGAEFAKNDCPRFLKEVGREVGER